MELQGESKLLRIFIGESDLFEKCRKGGLITIEKAEVLYYKPKK